MKRIILVVNEVEKCIECPFFGSHCGEEDEYTDMCDKLNIKKTFEYTDEAIEEEEEMLKEWFEKLCPFEELK